MPTIDTILSPALFDLYKDNIQTKDVVIIDILRATTTICVAFDNGVLEMIPVGQPEEAANLKTQNYLAAAERNGKTVDGFELGNSPQEYTSQKVKGEKIAFTTTNGTRALELAKEAANVYIGSFLNLQALVKKLLEGNRDILLFCAGWKDKVNIEDTLFAGAVAESLKHRYDAGGDAVMIARDLYNNAKEDLNNYLQKASHVQRFKTLHVESDLDVCLQLNSSKNVPVFRNGCITLPTDESAHLN